MTNPQTPAQPPWFWLTMVAVGLGIVVLGVRLLTLPESSFGAVGIGILVAVAVTVGILIGLRLLLVAKLRTAEEAFPSAVVAPIALGIESGSGFRWAATRLGDEGLRVGSSGSAVVAIDAAGLHLVRSAAGPHGVIPASALAFDGAGRTMVGALPRDSILLDVTLDGATAPLHLVPMRLRGNPFATLPAAERRDLARRIESALQGS